MHARIFNRIAAHTHRLMVSSPYARVLCPHLRRPAVQFSFQRNVRLQLAKKWFCPFANKMWKPHLSI